MTVLVAGALVAVPASIAQGAPGGGGKPDNPGQGQGGGGGGGNSGGNSGNSKSPKGNIYSDLWVIARDDRGVPITVTFTVAGEDGTETSTCVQPITFDPSTQFSPLTGASLYPYPYQAYLVPLAGDDAPTLGLEPCEVLPEYAAYVSEVDLGRLNLGRSPERVLAKQLGDVEVFLAGGEASLDASGRLVVNDVALDSPLANLAAYQSILETGAIGTTTVPSVDLGPLALTAAMLAAGSPKEDFTITVDTVQYLNRILGIPAQTGWGSVMPVVSDATGEEFLNYGTFPYDRDTFFPGCVTFYPLGSETTVTYPLQGFTDPDTGDWVSVVPFEGDGTGTGIDGYVQLAEDARDVLVWVHARGENVVAVDPITSDALCTTP